MTTELIAALINWVYQTSNEFELEFDRKNTPSIADFDRVRYFILAQDSEAYNVCID